MSTITEFQLLMFAQIGIDIIIVVVFILFIRRLRSFNRGKSSDKTVRMLESLLTDADKIAQQFKVQLEEKHHLIRSLNEQLDKRIASLNGFLQRSDALLSSYAHQAGDAEYNPLSLSSQEKQIIALAGKGYALEKIAKKLTIPEEEVKLVLDLKQKLSQIGKEEGLS
jgi:ATP/maltotriose-dependent transcriptional regulator MalT